jgi:hypothetical protein
MNGWDIHEGIAAAWKIVTHANAFVDSSKPFSLAKDPAQAARLDSVLYHLAEALTHVSVLLNPIMPTAMVTARAQIGWELPAGLKVSDLKWGLLQAATSSEPRCHCSRDWKLRKRSDGENRIANSSCTPRPSGYDQRRTLMKKALLALEDGRVFEGTAFGADAAHTGEICFNTSMTGYQEVLTDPSYRGQIVTMTYPLIGNYGVNPLDTESDQPHVRGFVIEELCDVPSNWRSTQSLDAYLKEWNIPGIQGIDTRALTTHLRTRGAMRAVITTTTATAEEAVKLAAASPTMEGSDYVKEVSTKDALPLGSRGHRKPRLGHPQPVTES